MDGNFTLKAATGNVLTVTCIGYKGQEITVTNKPLIVVTMQEDSELLDEVVVIGYGQVKKGDVTGSLLTVKPDELNKGKQLTAEDALVGKVAGVNIVPGNGAPGSGGTIRIRMGASLSADNDPLIVIDGVPVCVRHSYLRFACFQWCHHYHYQEGKCRRYLPSFLQL